MGLQCIPCRISCGSYTYPRINTEMRLASSNVMRMHIHQVEPWLRTEVITVAAAALCSSLIMLLISKRHTVSYTELRSSAIPAVIDVMVDLAL